MTLKNSHFQESYERSRYNLTLRINVLLFISLICMGAVFYILETPVLLNVCIGLGVNGSLILYLKITKNYKLPAYIFSACGTLIIAATLLLQMDIYHFLEPLWMMMVILFSYFTLGKVWGHIILAFNAIIISFYLRFGIDMSLKEMAFLVEQDFYSLLFSSLICMIGIGYILNQFIIRNREAFLEFERINRELNVKNQLILKQNEEKTAMLMEIHHRVKNNLQVITSLLRLQSREMERNPSKDHFKEAIDRIGAMSLIHNQMYQSKDLNKINLEDYLNSLTTNIVQSYTLKTHVDIKMAIGISYVSPKNIVPISLLLNELISNSLKHAFTENKTGNITISFQEKEEGMISLSYTDNGEWKEAAPLPEVVNSEMAQEGSFGLELIDTLVEQLNGDFTFSSHPVTRYDFSFTLA